MYFPIPRRYFGNEDSSILDWNFQLLAKGFKKVDNRISDLYISVFTLQDKEKKFSPTYTQSGVCSLAEGILTAYSEIS